MPEAWLKAIEQTLQGLQTGARLLAEAKATVPCVGHELADDRGDVLAEAELAWPDERLVVLTPGQDDMKPIWVDEGWTVMVLSDDLQTIGAEPWWQAVGQALNVSIEGAEA